MRKPLKARENNMGRRPIHDEAMSAAERQRRRRSRLREEPWRDQRLAVRAILQALRDLQGSSEADGPVKPALLEQIIDRAVASMALDDETASAEARATVANLLDPDEPLPERSRRGHRGRRGHRMGDRMRGRHGRRGRREKDQDSESGGDKE